MSALETFRLSFALLLAALITSCAGIPTVQEQPLNQEEKALVGTWRFNNVSINGARAKGVVVYHPDRSVDAYTIWRGQAYSDLGRWKAGGGRITTTATLDQEVFPTIHTFRFGNVKRLDVQVEISGKSALQRGQRYSLYRVSDGTGTPPEKVYAQLNQRRSGGNGSAGRAVLAGLLLMGAANQMFGGGSDPGECDRCGGSGYQGAYNTVIPCLKCGGDGRL